ncbi:hypothetical protein SAMN02910447_03632 [Ruminococcus sp. YE71]|uniref:hypothetical protein n=1 Tax=unclassified Ruminococcus TaxID=2608920 RepID=UPI00087DFBB1|nr:MULTISPECIES: hypothetical protein [unclassified Ruminococcus]SDA32947.1 hypothetical protein SAMN02910446_03684 [Ruminococcus sp. YE78]SFW54665.1 hypothetical protein SAMN02910447_03632 [Ruminococcus sp. YE71]
MMKSKRILPFLLPIRSVIFPAVFIIQAEIAGKKLGDMVCWWSVTDTVLNLLTIALLVFAARKNGMTYGELINYRRGQSSVRRVICVTMLVLVLGMGGMYLAGFVCYGVFPYLAPMMAAPPCLRC